jgi:ABC-type polar amino acid transport system ATPase subunit
VIDVINLQKSFGKKEVLKGVNVTIEEGEKVFRQLVSEMKQGVKLD